MGMMPVSYTHLECEGQLELAMPLMQKIIKKHRDIDVVMALNDPSALGALAALENNGMKNVKVYGVDGTPDAVSYTHLDVYKRQHLHTEGIY